MKNIKYILIIILMIFIHSRAAAVDFYPELGVDPFYSSLNPSYEEDVEESDSSSLFNIIKAKREERKIKKEILKQQKSAKIAEEKDKKAAVEQEIKENTDKQKDSVAVFPKKKRVTVEEIEKDEKERLMEGQEKKTFWEKLNLSFIPLKKEKNHDDVPENPQLEISADYMEYYPDRFEVEAIGNAKIVFTKGDLNLSANKIVYNYDRNIVKANENVVLTSKDAVTEGDFVRIDLSRPDGWIENPVTKTEDIKLSAKEARLFSDRIEEYDGVAKILKNEVLAFRANSFANYVDQSGLSAQNYWQNKNVTTGIYSLKANTIYIDSRKEHDVITVKNADLFFKNHKIAVIPSARIVSNKKNTVIESNIPEFGSQSLLGMHAGPAVVLNVPGGSTLKLAPIVTYASDKIGIGGIAKFRNPYNVTEVAYGTSKDELLVRGRQKIAPGLNLNYSRLTNRSEWFLGFRKPKYAASLDYSRSDYVKDLGLKFSQLYSAGVFVDYKDGVRTRDAEGRFRWMTQSYKTLYSYQNDEGNIGFNVGLVAQTSAAAYTSGDVFGLFRVGPAVNTSVGPWKQSIMYFQTAIAGQTPFDFDRYRYGRSNVVLIESLRVCKYLTLGYLASIAMNREVRSDDLFQENRILVSIGPDYAKLTFGYDSIRHNTMVILSMLVGSQDSEVEFKKTVIKNPQNMGKANSKKKAKKRNYKRFLKEKITPSTVL